MRRTVLAVTLAVVLPQCNGKVLISHCFESTDRRGYRSPVLSEPAARQRAPEDGVAAYEAWERSVGRTQELARLGPADGAVCAPHDQGEPSWLTRRHRPAGLPSVRRGGHGALSGDLRARCRAAPARQQPDLR